MNESVPRGVCEMNGNENGNIIECICRKYRVQTRNGMIVEVESTKPLSEQTTQKLLHEDDDIDLFFSTHNIMAIRHMVMTPINNNQEKKIEGKLTPKNGRFTPRQRLNHILKMTGEFTRNDYQKHMLDKYGVIIPKFMAHTDIKGAIVAKRLEIVEGKVGRERKYRVIDPTDVDNTLYKTISNDRKIQMGVLH
jgi:hypothetical protein